MLVFLTPTVVKGHFFTEHLQASGSENYCQMNLNYFQTNHLVQILEVIFHRDFYPNKESIYDSKIFTSFTLFDRYG